MQEGSNSVYSYLHLCSILNANTSEMASYILLIPYSYILIILAFALFYFYIFLVEIAFFL